VSVGICDVGGGGFHSFLKKEPNQTNRFRLVRLIGLFENTIKKISYSHKIVFHA